MRGDYRAVGIDNLTEKTNSLAYGVVVAQYQALLDKLGLRRGTTALDAGAGIGAFTRVLHDRGFDLTALDISQTALDGIHLPIRKVCSPIADGPFADREFEYVHSFDVLYHIMDEAEWARSMAALCRWSSRHVVLHERFLRLPQLTPSKIMKMRRYGKVTRLMNENGFREVMSMPSYFISKHLLTYTLANVLPTAFHGVDSFVLKRFSDRLPVRLIASHHIKVFERV